MPMNITQIKCLSVFAIFAIIGFGPISPGCLIGMSVVLMRPAWFWQVMTGLYANVSPIPMPCLAADMIKRARIKCFLSLLGLFIIDIAPVPVTPVIAFVIIIVRPQWFYRIVATIYGNHQ